MKVELVSDADALGRLEPAWWDLYRRTAATPFISPAWLLPWWASFAPGQLTTVAIWQGNALAALAPLYVENGPGGRRLLPIGIGGSDYLDVLVDPAVPGIGAELTHAILRTADAWDTWSIEEARPGADVLALPIPTELAGPVEPQSACPAVSLRPTLRETIPPAQLRKWRMSSNRVARRRWSTAAMTIETWRDDLEQLFRLHAARWESRGEPGVLADSRVQDFHRRAVPALLAADLLHSFVLRIDDAVAGVYYGMRHRTEAYAYLFGFDPAFAFESPGTILFALVIEDAIARGAETLHLLRGQERYKYGWGASDRWNSRRTVSSLNR